MTEAHRQRLFDALMGETKKQGDPLAVRILEEVTLDDLNTIEPVLDAIIDEEVKERLRRQVA